MSVIIYFLSLLGVFEGTSPLIIIFDFLFFSGCRPSGRVKSLRQVASREKKKGMFEGPWSFSRRRRGGPGVYPWPSEICAECGGLWYF